VRGKGDIVALKKISAEALRVGMHIHELCGSWIDIPFWSKSFFVGTEELRRQVATSGVDTMWIDTERGCDVGADEPAAAPAGPAAAPGPPPFADIAPVSAAAEFDRAARIIAQSREAMTLMFSEARMGRVSGVEQAGALVEEIAASVIRNPQALVTMCRLKQSDDYTYMHSVAVCAMMIALARQMGMDDEQVRVCGKAGLLHDIGKMAIDSEILNKAGRLSAGEFARVQYHPQAGYDMLRAADGIPAVALDVCLHHHEKFGGGGYPFGLRGDQISIYARMGAVCDVYDAITSNRPYKAGWCPAESLQRMTEWSRDGHFDPAVFGAFVKCVGIYPIGTLLKLKSGRLAVVTDVGKSLLRPQVRVFFSTKSMTYLQPQVVDLSLLTESEGVLSREDPADWGLAGTGRYWMNP